ncbi:MAG: hypothetical protein PHX87_03355 [Candidatus Peribacteraceae bacterium]|nr:hypothetical protein [Candidatus Peribacteraceae bacterium]MDD5742444.1 hypothetical protein [Candidatus Peribacteraceae bacterium]
MTPEHRSFVGCGDEEYPIGDITSCTPPVGCGLRAEVLPKDVMLRMQSGENIHAHPGVGGEEYLSGENRNHAESGVEWTFARIVQYYIDSYNRHARGCAKSGVVRLKVRLEMNENEEPPAVIAAVNAWLKQNCISRDTAAEIEAALSRPEAWKF